MKTLAFAYACEPKSGSEPGSGWEWARLAARLGEVCVLTRENNRERIEAALPGTPEAARMRFVYVDLPPWARFWKRGRLGIHLYYLLWQMAALRVSRRLVLREPFDVAWHLTLANCWIGSTAAFIGLPLIYGPVGGGVRVPKKLLSGLSRRSRASEVLREIAKAACRANPLARACTCRARLILVQNSETLRWLRVADRAKALVFPNPVLDHEVLRWSPTSARSTTPPASCTALFAGRLIEWKGLAFAIAAIAQLPGWKLIVCGQGSGRARFTKLAQRMGVCDRVQFRGAVDRNELLRLMTESTIFLFPSLREEAGWVVAEALACGLPTVCLDIGGPPSLIADAGISISPHGQPSDVVNSLASTLQRGRYPARTHVLMRAQTFSLNQIHARLLEAFSSVDLEPDTDMYEREQGMKELATETNP